MRWGLENLCELPYITGLSLLFWHDIILRHESAIHVPLSLQRSRGQMAADLD